MASKKIPRKCEQCGADFGAFPEQLRKGHGRFCSLKCAANFQWAHRIPKPPKVKPPRPCKQCRKDFTPAPIYSERFKSLFCSPECAHQHRLKPAEMRFWAKVQKTAGCWLWTGGTTRFGYGTISARNKNYTAHRLSYELHKGLIPDGLCVCHTCDNPPCVNPAHLFLGTKLDNAHDMIEKGRAAHVILSKQAVKEIRRLYANGRHGHNEIATMYGVSKNTVLSVVTRKTWKHID